MASISSAELNLLIFQYLQESDFTHSSNAFGSEAGIDISQKPPVALKTIVQKGLQYMEMEASLSNSDIHDDVLDENFSFLKPWDIITKDVHELWQIINERKKKKREEDRSKDSEKEHEGKRGRVRGKERRVMKKAYEKYRERVTYEDDEVTVEQEEDLSFGGREPMDISTISASQPCEIPNLDVKILKGHTSEVLTCAWNPTGTLLASGSMDSTARIWAIEEGSSISDSQNGPLNVLVLKHVRGRIKKKSNDVTALDWNREGTLLATGSLDGQARIWTRDGELKNTLSKHMLDITSLKWNEKGDYLLTGSCDRTAIVWDVKTGQCKQQFRFHAGHILDVDWRDNESFATSSADCMIAVWQIGKKLPLKKFAGHKGDVNCVVWDSTGSFLASCSADKTAKIWSEYQDKYIYNLRGHSKEIYTIRWSPSGPGTDNPNQELVLASASLDTTVKLWNAEHGNLIHSLNGHRDSVFSVAFSPDCEYLASGSYDNSMHIWSLKEGKKVRTYTGNKGIYEVCWSPKGDKIAACFVDNTVRVLDFRM